ncbi:Epidermal retinol dehydrogenase 2 [Orchesella cincta]|uniref:Epidermal retinol dehydrogenase 2 n=1 Tax=Orchesella cincta TaxID=48709 RepID=A0A1D2N4Z3_ORCCI|nr:Epidermal retinol dehydrogenase 2 [Orchesella cincta]
MSNTTAQIPCIYDGLQPGNEVQAAAVSGGKNPEDVIQPADGILPLHQQPFKGAVVNHNNNTISVHSSNNAASPNQHRRSVSVTANCYLQMLTSPLKTYRERKAEAAAPTLVDESGTVAEPQEKSNFQKDMETALELMGAIAYAVYGITVALFVSIIPRRFRYKDITDQVVLVTGAGSGIGRLMAKKLALNHGAVIVAWDINKTGNEETVQQIRAAGGKCYGYQVDVSSRESIYATAEKVKAEVGKVEILINNAGIVSGKKLLDTPDAMIEKTFDVNILSNFWTLKAFLPAMMKDGRGHIVTIASTAGLIGVNKLVDYCSSKYAAIGLSEAVQSELRAEGYDKIYLTCVCPYYINTGMFDGVRSKVVSILKPEAVVNDIVAGILTNQEQIVMPRSLYPLLVLKMMVPGEVGRRIAAALGITGTMLSFKGRTHGPPPTLVNPIKSLDKARHRNNLLF